MTVEEAAEVLRQFVVRAVHIGAHSLATDREHLERLARGVWRVTFSLDRTATVERDLPDEERMESLASRVRPLTLAGEPIHHAKVMEAIETVLSNYNSGTLASCRNLVAELTQEWRRYGLDEDSLARYEVSMVHTASDSAPAVATDAQLAAGWFYTDVAHANPTGWKRDALLFSRATRYEAAVPRWSMLAATALRTLDLVRQLRDEGILLLPETAFESDLATAQRTPEETVVMVGPTGAPLPGPAGTTPGPEWVRLTVGEAARLFPDNRVDIALSRNQQEILRRPAAVLAKSDRGEDPFRMDVLLDEAILFHVVAHAKDLGKEVQAGFEKVWQTNRALADGYRFLEYLYASDALAYTTDDGKPFISYTLSPQMTQPSRSVTAEFINDVAVIESLLDTRLPLVDNIPSREVRAAVRVLRLAMEGELVPGPSGSVEVTVTSEVEPQAIALNMPPLSLGQITIPERSLLMWHPRARVESLGEQGRHRVTPPDGEQFLVWDPTVRDMGPASDYSPTAQVDV